MELSILTEDEYFIELADELSKHKSSYNAEIILSAYKLAYQAHHTQKRKSGEAYIIHPVAVAKILLTLETDTQSICAGLLHDVLEDTNVTAEQISKQFGEDVLYLVEGVTKLNKLSFSSERQIQAENFRKMFLAIAADARVVLVKLADRYHNMQTLHHLSPEKQQEIATETLEIFAPLANRFGLNYFKWQLEDLSLKYLNPQVYQKIKGIVDDNRSKREEYLASLISSISCEFEKSDIKGAQITGRAKHFYSIYNKIQRTGSEEIYDLLAIRIIVTKERQCYEALGIIHDLFKPLPGRFKDYIALPKSNMYQSLHTTVIGSEEKLVEIQIRTQQMHQIAEFGIAAHWKYKESGTSTSTVSQYDKQISSLKKQLLEMQQQLPDADEYQKAVQIDLFTSEIFVFSPKGDLYCLPRGSTPVDFAYYVHTEIGNTCQGAKINNRITPLHHELKNGDIVQIRTSKNAHPSSDWLGYVKSSSARHKIKQWFRKNKRAEYLSQGISLAAEIIGKSKFEELSKKKAFDEVAQSWSWSSSEDIFVKLGSGDISSRQLLSKLHSLGFLEKESSKNRSKAAPTSTSGKIHQLKDFMHSFAKCCQPVPDEEIKGLVSRGRGIVIHRASCPNIAQISFDRLLDIRWDSTEENRSKQLFTTTLEIECVDRLGISRDILDKIYNHKVNLSDMKVVNRPTKQTALLRIELQVADAKHLNQLINDMYQLSDIVEVRRYVLKRHKVKKPEQ